MGGLAGETTRDISDWENETEEYWRGLGFVDNADVAKSGSEDGGALALPRTTWDRSSTGGVRSKPDPGLGPPAGNSKAPLLSQLFLLISSSD